MVVEVEEVEEVEVVGEEVEAEAAGDAIRIALETIRMPLSSRRTPMRDENEVRDSRGINPESLVGHPQMKMQQKSSRMERKEPMSTPCQKLIVSVGRQR